jgi:hypothetical protein
MPQWIRSRPGLYACLKGLTCADYTSLVKPAASPGIDVQYVKTTFMTNGTWKSLKISYDFGDSHRRSPTDFF